MSTALGRRQSSRAVRSTAGRPQNYYSVQFSQTAEDPVPPDRQPGFFPAITHFTDSLDALPREVMRHFSMMKEVEAKLHAPDEELTKLAAQIATIPRPSTSNDLINTNSSNGQIATSDQSSIASASKDGREVDPAYLLRQLNYRIATMAPMLDEKIAVLSTASMTLSRQIEVMESSYKHVPEEVSPEARLGSTTHWAYVAEKEPKKTGTERTRREAAAANTYAGGISRSHDHDEASGRSEARREVLMARKIRNQQLDSDFEERPASRKQHAKSRKQAEQNQTSGGAVTIMNGASGPNKRKKPIGGAPPMERSMNAAMAGQKNQIGSPTLGAEVGKKRKNAPGPLPGRKRLQNSAPRSPRLVSSPLLGTFSVKESGNRGAHSRGRHGSQSSAIQPITLENAKAPPMSPRVTASKNGLPAVSETTPLKDVPAATAGPTVVEPEPIDPPSTKATADTALTLKREPAEAGEEQPIPETEQVASTVVTTRTGRVSKTATPIATTFPETTSSRNAAKSRAKDTGGNGSHASSESGYGQNERMSTREKRRREGKDASEARKIALAEEMPSENGEEEEGSEVEGDEEEENEPRYCYCNEVSYGEMVACDNENCPRQWFHLRCAGLREAPTTAKWYCDECKHTVKDGRRSRPNSRRE